MSIELVLQIPRLRAFSFNLSLNRLDSLHGLLDLGEAGIAALLSWLHRSLDRSSLPSVSIESGLETLACVGHRQ